MLPRKPRGQESSVSPGAALEARESFVILRVKVQPKASRCAVLDPQEDWYRIALTAPPVDGAANEALVKFLSKTLGVARGDIVLASGKQSRQKTLHVTGADLETVRAALALAAATKSH